MNWLDVVIVVVSGVAALLGWVTGGLYVAVTGVGVLVGITLASRQHERIAPLFSRFTDSQNGAEIIAFAVIFGLVLIASVIVSFLASTVLRKLMLGWADKVAGVALGIVLVFAAGSAIFSAIQSYPVYDLDDYIAGSALASFLADNFDVVLRGLKFIPDDLGT